MHFSGALFLMVYVCFITTALFAGLVVYLLVEQPFANVLGMAVGTKV